MKKHGKQKQSSPESTPPSPAEPIKILVEVVQKPSRDMEISRHLFEQMPAVVSEPGSPVGYWLMNYGY